MRKMNNTILVGFIGGMLISHYIGELRNEIKQTHQKIIEITNENNMLSMENKVLSNKNKEILKENNELQQKARESMNRNIVFNPDDVTIISKVSSRQLEKVFDSNSQYSGLRGLGEAFTDAEEKYNINALFLLGIVSQESGFGKSSRANRQNNMAGLAVYSDSSKGKSFSSKYESIMYLGKLLSKEYIKGRNIKTIYDINEVYCPNDNYYWSKSIEKIINDYIFKINSL